ncbi:MAG: NAD(P)-dependent oxidoreductase, partial [Halobacteria archaeon]
TKWEQEQIAMKWVKENGLPLTAIRPAPTYGPRNRYGMFNMFKLFSQGILTIIPSLYPRSKRIRIPMVHVTDVCRAALFLSDKERTVGEVYNVVADTHPTADELMEFVFPLLNVKAHRLIVPAAVFPLFHKMFHRMAVKMEAKAKKRGPGVRPPLEVDTVNYMMNSYLFSNAKIKNLGFEFDYADFRRGVWETVGWYRQQGWLDV